MRVFTKIGKKLKKILIPISVLASLVTIVIGIVQMKDRIQLFIINSSQDKTIGARITSKTIQIWKGETKLVFENDLLQITIDNILIIDGTNLYRVCGKINNGISTSLFENTQGESIQFDKFIIQINRIASDYAEFRVSNNYQASQ